MRIIIDCRLLQTASKVRGIGSYLIQLIDQYIKIKPADLSFKYLFWQDKAFISDQLKELIGSANYSEVKDKLIFIQKPKFGKLNWLKDSLFSIKTWKAAAKHGDLIHFPSVFELDFGWPSADIGIPKAVTVHDLMAVTHSDLLLSGKYKILKPIYKYQASRLKKADRLIFVSQHSCDETLRLLKTDNTKCSTVLNGAGESFRPASDLEIRAVRKKYSLPERFMLFLGGLSANKNLKNLLLASEKEHLLPIVIAGAYRPQDAAQLKQRFSKAIWIGRVPAEDLSPLYSAAAIYVMPSLCEGFGLPLAEAMSCGTPAACASRAPMTEVVQDAAVLFNPESPQDIAYKLKEASEDAQMLEELRKKSLIRAKELTFFKTAQNTLNVYRKTLNLK